MRAEPTEEIRVQLLQIEPFDEALKAHARLLARDVAQSRRRVGVTYPRHLHAIPCI